MCRLIPCLLQVGDERSESGGEYDQIARVRRRVCVRDARGHVDRTTCAYIDLAIGKPEMQTTFEDVPGLIVGMMHMKSGRSAAAPFLNGERDTSGPETLAWFDSRRGRQRDDGFNHVCRYLGST